MDTAQAQKLARLAAELQKTRERLGAVAAELANLRALLDGAHRARVVDAATSRQQP